MSYPRLPSDPEEFKEEFINSANLSIQNKIVLQKRLTGLISYYRGSDPALMPRVIRDELVPCEMSDYALDAYIRERIGEIRGEQEKEKGKEDKYSDVEMYAKMKNPSSYRFRSRALCNFAFPKPIERPFPKSKEEEEQEVVDVEDLQMTEIDTIPEEDLRAQEEVALEDKQIEAQGPVEGEGEKEAAIDVERVQLAALQDAVEEEEKGQAGGDGEEYNDEEEEEEEDSEEDDDDSEEEDEEQENEEEEDNKGEEDMEGGAGEDGQPSSASKPPRKLKRILNAENVASAVSSAADAAAASIPSGENVVSALTEAASAVASTIAPALAPAPSTKPVRKLKKIQNEETEESAASAVVSAVSSAAAAVAEAVVPKPASAYRVMQYQERIAAAMKKLDSMRDNFLRLESVQPEATLRQYSTKLDHMLRRIEVSRGSNLVYSQFKTVEGLGVLGVALRANGYVEIKIDGGDNNPSFSKETEDSLRKGPLAKEKRFITFTGEGSKERRTLVLNIFNGKFDKLPSSMRTILEESGYGEKRNRYGDICWVIGITGAGAEGISLKCCRTVHIMEPYWNNVRLEQVKGRAIRICSHEELPFKEREVEIYTYCSAFSAAQKNSNKIDMTIRTNDDNKTSDEMVYDVSLRKDKINQEIINMMKESAVDCGLNAPDNQDVQCFMVDGRPDQYMFDPNLQVDKMITSSQFKEEQRVKADIMDMQQSVAKELGAPPPSAAADKIQVRVMKYKGVEYLIYPKPESGGLVFQLFARGDDRFRQPLGEVTINPVTGTFKGSKVVMML